MTISCNQDPDLNGSNKKHNEVALQLRLAFYALIASLPTEGVDFGATISASRVLGCLFLLIALFHPGISFRFPPRAFWWFGIYSFLYFVLVVFQPSEFWDEVLERVFTLCQLLVFFWIACNLLRDPRVARGAILALGISCAVCALLQLSGSDGNALSEGRSAAFGQNPNRVAAFFSLGLLGLAYLAYSGQTKGQRFAWWPWPLCALLAVAIVQTGSRGGLLSAGSSTLVFLLDKRLGKGWTQKVIVVLLVASILVGMSYFSDASRQRWEGTIARGEAAHREQLFPTAWRMFTEKPLAGWGPITALYELGTRTKYLGWAQPEKPKRDTHNLALHVLTATGILGAIPFVIGMWLCVRAAWRARAGIQGILPLAMVVSLIVSNMCGDWVYVKCHWFVLAYAIASEAQLCTRVVHAIGLRRPYAWAKQPVISTA
jgi:O-antigen ligase